ncbi:MAG TPA: hypothetical protein VKN63_05125 [Afifellaceae bacterium]|nr:hypothetical protein [Afifellaceae bacterium]
MNNDKFGINTYSYTQSMGAADCLNHLADLGARTIELMFYPDHLWISDDAAIVRTVARFGATEPPPIAHSI